MQRIMDSSLASELARGGPRSGSEWRRPPYLQLWNTRNGYHVSRPLSAFFDID